MKGPGPVEYDESLPSAAGADLMICDQRVTRQRAPVRGMAEQLAGFHRRTQASQHARQPLRLAAGVPPAVDRRGGQRDPGERHVQESKAPVSEGHRLTVPPPRLRLARARSVDGGWADVIVPLGGSSRPALPSGIHERPYMRRSHADQGSRRPVSRPRRACDNARATGPGRSSRGRCGPRPHRVQVHPPEIHQHRHQLARRGSQQCQTTLCPPQRELAVLHVRRLARHDRWPVYLLSAGDAGRDASLAPLARRVECPCT